MYISNIGDMDMKELVNKIDELIDQLQQVSRLCISNETVDLKKALAFIYNNVADVFPGIIKSYDIPELAEYAEEAGYWASQIQRITDTCAGEDRFLAVDVLYQETRANLIEYKDRLIQKGLV